jgi:HSP20 family protein
MYKRNPDRFQRELQELFSDLWQVPGFVGARGGFRPHVDCFRTEEPPAVTLIVELAGVDPDDVEVVVGEQTVVVRGTRRRPMPACRVSYRHLEIEYGPFERRLALTEDVDPGGAEATYSDGLLKIALPLAQRPRSGKVSISIGAKK